jgi:hypothetical protein
MDHTGVRNGGILRVLRGASLPCGCVAGIYETYTGTTVAVIDEAHAECRVADHRNGHMISIEAKEGPRQDA